MPEYTRKRGAALGVYDGPIFDLTIQMDVEYRGKETRVSVALSEADIKLLRDAIDEKLEERSRALLKEEKRQLVEIIIQKEITSVEERIAQELDCLNVEELKARLNGEPIIFGEPLGLLQGDS